MVRDCVDHPWTRALAIVLPDVLRVSGDMQHTCLTDLPRPAASASTLELVDAQDPSTTERRGISVPRISGQGKRGRGELWLPSI